MESKLKGIFKISASNDAKEEEGQGKYSSFKQFSIVNWKTEGWESAKNQHASETGLKVCIAKIYHNHKELLRRDHIEQEKAKKPYRVKLQGLETKNQSLYSKIDRLKDETLKSIQEKILECQMTIQEVKNNPESIINGKSEKAGFFIGLIILLFLTLYLFVFYSSASYSAFFKIFTLSDLGVADSIFDPQAVSKAYKDGLTELILILTIPFVFVGLGYLIHKFQEKPGFSKVLKIAAVVAVTFVFDAILAYEITEKIYNLNASNSFNDMPPYTVKLAFSEVNFWLIIFAGFVVYLIWGFVFDFIMEAHYKMDKLAVAIRGEKEKIKELEKKKTETTNEIDKLMHLIGENSIEAEKLKTILDYSDIIKPKELENSIHQFLDGWLEWMASDRRNETDKQIAHVLVGEFIELNISLLEIETNGG
ncbi:MAG: cell division protein FtsB [Parvicella sp.]|jgi:cell division protein FtsB